MWCGHVVATLPPCGGRGGRCLFLVLFRVQPKSFSDSLDSTFGERTAVASDVCVGERGGESSVKHGFDKEGSVELFRAKLLVE